VPERASPKRLPKSGAPFTLAPRRSHPSPLRSPMPTTSASPPTVPASCHSRLQGIGWGAAAASVFSVNTVLARLAFEGGTDTATLNATRFVFTVLVLLVFFAARRRQPRLTLRQRFAACGLGVAFFLTSYGYMGAIQYIPVSVAVLVLYTYPILVGLISSLAERTALTPLRLSALILAFVGLALALNVEASSLPDWRGVALAFIASLGMAVMVVGSSRTMRGAEPSAVNLHLLVSASVLFLVLLVAGGGPAWPHTASGQQALIGVLVTFATAQITLIAAIRHAGSVLAAAVMNLEPIITVALAVTVVGESLTLRQLVGAALVIAAIYLTSRPERRAARLGGGIQGA